MKTGIFGGAFNPIHNGHIALAKNYLNHLGLDRIVFVPTHIPPHKTNEDFASETDRMAMLNLAIKNCSAFEADDCEFRREGKSYTYDTICDFKSRCEDELFLIVGEDQYLYFDKWYKYEQILDMVTLLTASRHSDKYNELIEYKNTHLFMKNSVVSNFDVIELSSSQIRQMVKNNEDISSLVPEGVAEYIKEQGLYV